MSYTPRIFAPLFWGNNSVAASVDTRYLTPGYENNSAQTTPTFPALIVAQRPVIIKNFYVCHSIAVGNGNSVVYNILINGVASGITVTVPTGVISTVSDVVNQAIAASGAKIDLQCVKALALGNGGVSVTAYVGVYSYLGPGA